MAWDAAFQPDITPGSAPPMALDPAFQPDQSSDPHTLGQQAAQGAGVKPIAPTPPLRLPQPSFGSNRGVAPAAPAAPTGPATEEPTFAATDTPPGVAAPEAATRLRDAAAPANPADYDAIKAAQRAIQDKRIGAVTQALQTAHPGATFEPNWGGLPFTEGFHLGRIDQASDRAAALNKDTPGSNAEVVNVPGIGPMTITQDPNNPGPYHPLNTPDWSNAGNLGSTTAAIVNPTNIATLLASIFMPETRIAQTGAKLTMEGPSLLARGGIMGGVGGAAKLGDQEVQKATGDISSPQSDILKNAGESAGLNVAGEGLGSLFSTAINAARGGGFINVLPDVAAGVRAGKELGLPPVSYGEMHPTLGNVQNLASRNSQVPENAMIGKRSALADLMSSLLGKTDSGAMEPANLAPFVDAWRATELSAVKNPGVSPLDAGKAAQEGMNEKLGPLNSAVTPLYQSARDASASGAFDTAPFLEKADALDRGVMAPTRASPEAAYGPAGETAAPTLEKIGGLSGPVSDIVSGIRNRPTTLTSIPGSDSPLAVLELYRQKLGRLATTNAATNSPEANEARHQANQLLPVLDSVIASPVGANAAEVEGKIQAARSATAAVHKVFDTEDGQFILKTDNPAKILPRIAAPYQEQTLQTMKNTLDPQKWQVFKDGHTTQLLNDPTKINQALDQFAQKDPKALSVLYTPDEQAALRDLGTKAEKFNTQPVVDALTNQAAAGDRAMQVFNNSTSSQLKGLIAQDKTGEVTDSMKHGLIASLIKDSLYQQPGVSRQLINPSQLQKSINEAMSSGKMQLVLNPDEIANMKLIRDYATTVGKVKGTAGISGPEKSMAAIDIFQPPGDTLIGQAKLGLGHLLANAVVGNKPSVLGSALGYAINSEGKNLPRIQSAKIAGQLYTQVYHNLKMQEPTQ